MEAVIIAKEAQLETLETEFREICRMKMHYDITRSCSAEPSFDDVVDAFRADPVAALAKYTAIQKKRRDDRDSGYFAREHSRLKSQISELKSEVDTMRAAELKKKHELEMATFTEKYGAVAASIRVKAESTYKELGSAMINSAARNKFGGGFNKKDPNILRLDSELDAMAKVLMDDHGIKVEYENNCILFTECAAGGKRKREDE
jgi:hypothetical protein